MSPPLNIPLCHPNLVSTRSVVSEVRTHTRLVRPASARWAAVEDLQAGQQYQFWVTAVTSAGEGMSSNVVTHTTTSKGEVPQQILVPLQRLRH